MKITDISMKSKEDILKALYEDVIMILMIKDYTH